MLKIPLLYIILSVLIVKNTFIMYFAICNCSNTYILSDNISCNCYYYVSCNDYYCVSCKCSYTYFICDDISCNYYCVSCNDYYCVSCNCSNIYIICEDINCNCYYCVSCNDYYCVNCNCYYYVSCNCLKGHVRTVMESHGNSCLEPTPNFDCHISKTISSDMINAPQESSLDNSQV